MHEQWKHRVARAAELIDLGIPRDAISPDDMRRVRIIVITTVALCLVGGPSVIQFLRVGIPGIALAVIGTMVASIANLALLRVTLRPRLAGHLGISFLTAIVTTSNVGTGGFYDPNFAWLYIIPLAAAVAIDFRGAAIWTGVVLVITVSFWMLPELGIFLENGIPVDLRAGNALFTRTTAILAIGAIGASFVIGQRRAERQLALANEEVIRETAYVHLLIHATVAANEATSLEGAMNLGVERICIEMGWTAGQVYEIDDEGCVVAGRIGYVKEPERYKELVKLTAKRRYRPGEGLLGKALATRSPQFVEGFGKRDERDVVVEAKRIGIVSALAVPVFVNGEVHAILQFASSERLQNVDRLLEVFALIGGQLGKVAERTALQERVQQSQKMEAVGQLAAGLAHEINNPMSYVRSNLHSLREQWLALRSKRGGDGTELAEEFDDCQELIEESLEGVERTIAIVRDVGEFSHTGAGDRSDWETADLSSLLASAARVASARASGGVRIEEAEPDEAAVCRCSPNQLRQVFVNLIVNAIQAVGDSGTIRLSTGHDGDEVFARVRDDGPGMSESVRERLFDPFFTTKPVGEGTGLGLSVSYEIVRNHGGEIRATSELGEGATFEVRLPAERG